MKTEAISTDVFPFARVCSTATIAVVPFVTWLIGLGRREFLKKLRPIDQHLASFVEIIFPAGRVVLARLHCVPDEGVIVKHDGRDRMSHNRVPEQCPVLTEYDSEVFGPFRSGKSLYYLSVDIEAQDEVSNGFELSGHFPVAQIHQVVGDELGKVLWLEFTVPDIVDKLAVDAGELFLQADKSGG